MKKFLIIFVALLIATTSFAQMPVKKTIKDKSPVQFGNQPAQTISQQKNADASFWFSFIDDLELFWGAEELEGFGPPMQCDSLGLFPFSNYPDPSPVQFMSLGQVFDWTYKCWREFYDMPEYEDILVPYLAESNNYSVDSLLLCYYYKRGTNVPTDVVDTLAISYILNLDNEPIRTLSNAQGPAFSMLYLPYNEYTFMADYVSGDGEISLSSDANIVYDKIPLTIADTTEGDYFYYFSLPVPTELASISCKKLAIAFTFIPGNERNINSLIGTDLNLFRTVMYDDPRPEYLSFGSEELCEDINTGLFTDAENFVPTSGWYGIYNPNIFWVGNPHPYIALKVTCNDCPIVNVEDMETHNITVSPNPATNNIKVNLAGDGKAQIQLFNLVGQLVYNETATTNTTINVSDLQNGIYMLKVIQNNKVYTSKVVVK